MKRLTLILLLIIVAFPALAFHPAFAQDEVLIQDNFTDNLNGWKLSYAPSTTFEIRDGALNMMIHKDHIVGWVLPSPKLPPDIQVEVEAQPIAPILNTEYSFGVVMRSNTPDNNSGSYCFAVDGDGIWRAWVYPPSNPYNPQSLQSGKLTSFDPNTPFKFKITSQGNLFSFTLNDTKLVSLRDTTIANLKAQYVGLLVGSFDTVSSPRIQFKNFKVTRLPTLPTVTPTLRPTQSKFTPTPRPVLLKEPFDKANTNQWTPGSTQDMIMTTADKSLTLEEQKIGITAWTSPSLKLPSNVDVTVTIKNPKPDAKKNWFYGIGIRGRLQEGKPVFYSFHVSSSGVWYFEIREGMDPIRWFVDRKPVPGFYGGGANKLRVVAVGSHFEFYFNGQKLGEFDDNTLPSQDENMLILLMCHSGGDEGSTTAIFSDLTVLAS